jgi:hypothetical protein
MGDNKIILANGPLVALLIQIQFSPILQISKYIPSIQDELRRKGFPLFKQVEGEGVPPFEGNYEQWMFIANDYSKNIVLDNQKITYQVFDCGTYSCENYAKDFIAIINSFNHTVDISSIIRIGLRWVNSIPLLHFQLPLSPMSSYQLHCLVAIDKKQGYDFRHQRRTGLSPGYASYWLLYCSPAWRRYLSKK